MSIITVPFVAGLDLGRSVNYLSSRFGPYIAGGKKAKKIELDKINYNFDLVSDVRGIKEKLSISGKASALLSLKVPFTGNYEGRYKHLTTSVTNKCVWGVLITVDTGVETFNRDMEIDPKWRQKAENMTHFVQSITYGGYLDLIFEVDESANMTESEMEHKLSAVLQNIPASGELETGTASSTEEFANHVRVRIKAQPFDPASEELSLNNVGKIVKRFFDSLDSTNKKMGSPLRCTLHPKSMLDHATDVVSQKRECFMTDIAERLEEINIADILLSGMALGRLSDYGKSQHKKYQGEIEDHKKRFRSAVLEDDYDELKKLKQGYDKNHPDGIDDDVLRFIYQKRDDVPENVARPLKEIAAYCSWEAANTEIGYGEDAEEDRETADRYHKNLLETKFFTEEFCDLYREMAAAAARRAAYERFRSGTGTVEQNKRVEKCFKDLKKLKEMSNGFIENLRDLCFASGWYTANTRKGYYGDADNDAGEIRSLYRDIQRW